MLIRVRATKKLQAGHSGEHDDDEHLPRSGGGFTHLKEQSVPAVTSQRALTGVFGLCSFLERLPIRLERLLCLVCLYTFFLNRNTGTLKFLPFPFSQGTVGKLSDDFRPRISSLIPLYLRAVTFNPQCSLMFISGPAGRVQLHHARARGRGRTGEYAHQHGGM